MRILLTLALAVAITGCANITKLWPRAHDPVLVDRWVSAEVAVTNVDCAAPTGAWLQAQTAAQHLYLLADFRKDPQADNLKGLWLHTQKMNTTTNRMFCEIGKRTAQARLAAARSAWEGR